MSKLHLHQKCHHGNKGLVHSTGSKEVEVKVDYISLVVVKVEVEIEAGINKAEETEEDTINKVTSNQHT